MSSETVGETKKMDIEEFSDKWYKFVNVEDRDKFWYDLVDLCNSSYQRGKESGWKECYLHYSDLGVKTFLDLPDWKGVE